MCLLRLHTEIHTFTTFTYGNTVPTVVQAGFTQRTAGRVQRAHAVTQGPYALSPAYTLKLRWRHGAEEPPPGAQGSSPRLTG